MVPCYFDAALMSRVEATVAPCQKRLNDAAVPGDCKRLLLPVIFVKAEPIFPSNGKLPLLQFLVTWYPSDFEEYPAQILRKWRVVTASPMIWRMKSIETWPG